MRGGIVEAQYLRGFMPQRHDLVDPLTIVVAPIVRLVRRARIMGAIHTFAERPILGMKQNRQHARLAQRDQPARQPLFLRIGGENGLVAFRNPSQRRFVGDMFAPRFGRVQHRIAETRTKVAERHADVEKTLTRFALQRHARQPESPQRQFDRPPLRRRQIGKVRPCSHARHCVMMRAVLARLHQIARDQRLGRSMGLPQLGRIGHPCKMADGRPCPRQKEVRPLRRQDDAAKIIRLTSCDLRDRRAMLLYRLLNGGNHMRRIDGSEIRQVGIGKQGIEGGHGYSWLGPEGREKPPNWAMTSRSSSSHPVQAPPQPAPALRRPIDCQHRRDKRPGPAADRRPRRWRVKRRMVDGRRDPLRLIFGQLLWRIATNHQIDGRNAKRAELRKILASRKAGRICWDGKQALTKYGFQRRREPGSQRGIIDGGGRAIDASDGWFRRARHHGRGLRGLFHPVHQQCAHLRREGPQAEPQPRFVRDDVADGA